jgi:putative ABC transport system permease protein
MREQFPASMKGTLGELIRRLRMLLRRKQFDRDMDEEMRLHIELREKELRENGAPPEQAYTEARRHFGNALALREASHESWGWVWLEHLAQDLRYAFRMLRKNPGFTSIAVLTLALGIGANTAVFSIVNAIYLSPLPYPNAQRIYVVGRTGNRFGGDTISPAIFAAWRHKQEGVFEHLTLLRWLNDSTLTGSGEAQRIPSAGISTDFLAMLGVHPVLGRDFLPEEGQVGGPNVVMLGNTFWRSHFGADPNAVGHSIILDDQPHTIIGVLPAAFSSPIPSQGEAQLWFPVRVPATSTNVGNGGLLCLGMLKPGVTLAQAEGALTPSLAGLRQEFPKMFMPGERAHLVPIHQLLNAWAGSAPLLLFGAVALVLLIACANVASLTLARSATRQREMAVRTAIGASRGRIVRQLLTESIALAVFGGILGFAACFASFRFIVALVPVDLPHVGAFQLDTNVLVFAFALSIVTGIVFGLAPALGTSRVDLSNSLKEASAQSGAGRAGRMRNILASAELALSLILLIGAALSLESFARLTGVNPGFDSSNLLTFRVDLAGKRYATPVARSAFFDQAVSRVSALPGVEEAAIIDTLPLEEGSDILFSIEGAYDAPPSGQPLGAYIRFVTPAYFGALRIPLETGRVFTASDNASNAPVMMVNHAFAEMYFAGKNPIGHSIWVGKPMGPAVSEPAPRQIIGIVGDIHESSLAERGGPTIFVPYAQARDADSGFFLIRTRRSAMLSFPDVRSALHSLDASIPLIKPETLDSVVSDSLTGWRFHAVLLGTFGALALFIAAIGVYGVISYSVAQRTHEIGIRLALGAQHRSVLRLVVGQGLKLACIGITIGIAAAFALTRLMANFLFGVSATDPLTFAGVAILLVLVAMLACYIPARRAMRVDPMIALRYE